MGLTGLLSPSTSYLAVVDEEVSRLLGPLKREDLMVFELESCLASLIDLIPPDQRVAIVTRNRTIDRELHIALGATGRVPSLFATSDWVIRELDEQSRTSKDIRAVVKCQGFTFTAEKRDA